MRNEKTGGTGNLPLEHPHIEQDTTQRDTEYTIPTAAELLDLVVQARIDSIHLNAIDESEAITTLLTEAFDTLAKLAGIGPDELRERQESIDRELEVAKIYAAAPNGHGARAGSVDLEILDEKQTNEMLWGLFGASIGRDIPTQNILHKTAMHLSQYYTAWRTVDRIFEHNRLSPPSPAESPHRAS